MDKSSFLSLLDKKLCYLVEPEKEKEISKYTSVIDNYINMGQSETDAVSSLGDVDALVTAIYLSHGLDYKKLNGSDGAISGDNNPFKNFYKLITSKDKKTAGNALLYFVYLILLVILLKVVFILIRDVSSSVFNDVISSPKFNKIYSLCFDLIYIVCAIILFWKLFKKKFGNNKK